MDTAGDRLRENSQVSKHVGGRLGGYSNKEGEHGV